VPINSRQTPENHFKTGMNFCTNFNRVLQYSPADIELGPSILCKSIWLFSKRAGIFLGNTKTLLQVHGSGRLKRQRDEVQKVTVWGLQFLYGGSGNNSKLVTY